MSQIVTPPILSSNLSYLIPPNNNNVFSQGYGGSSIITANTTKTDSTTTTTPIVTTNNGSYNQPQVEPPSNETPTPPPQVDLPSNETPTPTPTPTPQEQTSQKYTNLKTALKIKDCDNFIRTTSGYYGLIMSSLVVILGWSVFRWVWINVWQNANRLLWLPKLDLSMIALPIIYISLYSVYYNKYKNEVDGETLMKIMIGLSIGTIIALFLFGHNFLNTHTVLPGLQLGLNFNGPLLRNIMYAAQGLFLILFNFVFPYLLFKALKKKKEANLVNQMFVIIIVANILYFIVLASCFFLRREVNWSLLGIFVFWVVAYVLIYVYMMKKQQYTIAPLGPSETLKDNWSIKFLYLKCFITFIIIMLSFLYYGIFRNYGGGDIRVIWRWGDWNGPNGGYISSARIYFSLLCLNLLLNFSLLYSLIHTYIRTYVCSKTTSS